MSSPKALMRQSILDGESTERASGLAESKFGKAAERLRRIPPYQKARRVLVSLDPSLKQVGLNALADRKLLVIPSRSLLSGFLALDPETTPLRKRSLAVQPHKGNPFAVKIPYGRPLEPPVDLIVTAALAVGRDGSRLGDGQGHLDLQVAVLGELGWIHPAARVVVLVDEGQIHSSIPMASHDVFVHWIVTPHEGFVTAHAESPLRALVWSRLNKRQIRRNDALFFLFHRYREEGVRGFSLSSLFGDEKRA